MTSHRAAPPITNHLSPFTSPSHFSLFFFTLDGPGAAVGEEAEDQKATLQAYDFKPRKERTVATDISLGGGSYALSDDGSKVIYHKAESYFIADSKVDGSKPASPVEEGPAKRDLKRMRVQIDPRLGPLIGKRTWGGVRGIRGLWPLLDGGYITVPEFALYGLDSHWVIENYGVPPDTDIEDLPGDLLAGHDAQLEAGINYVMKQIQEHPKPLPSPPPLIPAYPPPGE